jgi:hypothetical protein
MKKFLIVLVVAITLMQKGFAQQSTQSIQTSTLLSLYYNIKDALVAGDAANVATSAGKFIKTANSIDNKVISEENIITLVKDASKINKSKDIKTQRKYFAGFSTNMAAVAKTVKLSNQAVYLQYCPMKKASWLSAEKQIRNPYYGSSMLTCGQVTETFQ